MVIGPLCPTKSARARRTGDRVSDSVCCTAHSSEWPFSDIAAVQHHVRYKGVKRPYTRSAQRECPRKGLLACFSEPQWNPAAGRQDGRKPRPGAFGRAS
jgi:hypothetical protein